MKVTALDHIVLCVADVERSIAFYEKALGMRPREERPGKWSLHFGAHKISLQDARTVPEIARATVPGSGNFCVLADEPIAHVAAALRERGVEIVDGPGEREGATGRIASIYIRDPDGNLVEISNLLAPREPKPIEYRSGRPSDAGAIANLHARSWRENYRGSYDDAFLDGDLPGERLRVWRERLDRPAGNQFVELAFADGDLAGFVCAYGAEDAEWGSLIDNLHVARSFKGMGIGATLMRRAGAWLASRYPDDAVHLLVLEVNAAARRFYERLGGRNAQVSMMEAHGGAQVRSCRYVWTTPAALSAPSRGGG